MTDTLTPASETATPDEPPAPLVFNVNRKALQSALKRTQHALAKNTDPPRPPLEAWWLSALGSTTLYLHTSDNYRIAQCRVEIDGDSDTGGGPFGIHGDEGKALIAFLSHGPDDALFRVDVGGWSIACGSGHLSGPVMPVKPPAWGVITDRVITDPVAMHASGRYLSEAAKAVGEGFSGIVHVDHATDPLVPYVLRSDDMTEWVMPVRVPEGA